MDTKYGKIAVKFGKELASLCKKSKISGKSLRELTNYIEAIIDDIIVKYPTIYATFVLPNDDCCQVDIIFTDGTEMTASLSIEAHYAVTGMLESINRENFTNKKYDFTGESIRYNGRTLRRIRRISDGLRGGWIESENNLSHKDSCFVYDDAKVYGEAVVSDSAEVADKAKVYSSAKVYNDAKVYGNAEVCGNTLVYGNATVHGEAVVSDNAEVFDSANVYDNAWVHENARVYNDARIHGNAWIYGDAKVHDTAQVYGDAWVYAYAKVYGNASVYGSAEIRGNAKVYDEAKISGKAEAYGNAEIHGNAKVSRGNIIYELVDCDDVSIYNI